MQQPISGALAALIADAYVRGYTQRDIAARYGVACSTVSKTIRQFGIPGRQDHKTPKPCGTVAAYRRHLRNGETPCAPCFAAHSDYQHAKYLNRKAPR